MPTTVKESYNRQWEGKGTLNSITK